MCGMLLYVKLLPRWGCDFTHLQKAEKGQCEGYLEHAPVMLAQVASTSNCPKQVAEHRSSDGLAVRDMAK